MKRFRNRTSLCLLLVLALLAGCMPAGAAGPAPEAPELTVVTLPPAAETAEQPAPAPEAAETAPAQLPAAAPETPPEAEPEETPVPDLEGVAEDGEYSGPEEVAEYLHLFGHLPGNYITKREAQSLGWDSREGNLWEVAPGKSIGGDSFGNREGLLSQGKYRECDVNFDGGYRGPERLIYGEDGSVWYTSDHYGSFTRLY